jgi:hypothetical protein
VALIAVAFLINNLLLFRDTVNQYVAQGYAAADVVRGLLPGQLVPGVFQPIAVYGGIAMLLYAAANINHQLSLSLGLLDQPSSPGQAADSDDQPAAESTTPDTDDRAEESAAPVEDANDTKSPPEMEHE